MPRIGRASFAQERLFFLNELTPGHPGYVVALALRIRGTLDVAALRQALSDLVARHDVLRTTFALDDGVLTQRVHDDAQPVVDVQVRALAGDAGQDADLRDLVSTQARQPFSLTDGPVIRATIVSWSAEEHALALLVHHIACDGWSVGILLHDLAALYNGHRLDVPVSYLDHSVDKRAEWDGVDSRALEFWRETLTGVPQLALYTDHPRPPVLSHRGAVLRRPVDTELVTELGAWARGRGTTLFAVTVAAYAAVLARYTRQDEVVVGVPVANRLDEDEEALVGCLVNTLPLRIDVSGEPTFAQLVDRVSETARAALAYQDVPFEQIVRAVDAERQLGHAPLFQTSLSLQSFPFALPELDGLTVTEVDVEIDAAKFDLGITLDVAAGEPFLRAEYSTDLFEAGTVARLLDHLGQLLRSIGGDSEPSMVGADEAVLVTQDFNPERTPTPDGPGLLKRFEEHATRHPSAVAVRHQGRDLTYGELSRWSSRIAALLRRDGVSQGDLVGLLLRRSPAVVAAILAVWKAGAAYVPLDPDYPEHRLRLIVDDSRVPVVLVEDGTAAVLDRLAPGLRALDVNTADDGSDVPDPTTAPDDLAYVIYTSGSTGVPKGVMVAHAGLDALFAVPPGGLDIASDDVWLCAHSFSFDFSVWEMWGALSFGGRVVVADADDLLDPARVAGLIQSEGVTVLSQTPGALYRLLPGLLDRVRTEGSALRYVVSGGEALSWTRLAGLVSGADRLHAEFVNMYGITEGTVHVTAGAAGVKEIAGVRAITGVTEGSVGVPLPSGRCYVLDERRRPTGVGVPGELYIGGALVAKGYLHNPELSATRFVPDPYSDVDGAMIYRTGDIARWTADGELLYLGREDGQIQLRGYRVECAEVERAFLRHPAVRACAVLADGDELLAFVSGDLTPGVERDLRAHAGEILPRYMVPSRIVAVGAVPLTAHGKVDGARLLRELPPAVPAQRVPESAGTPIEERIRRLWVEVLDRSDVGLTDNFFDLGGHSFALVALQNKLVAAGFDVSVTDLFRFGTVQACARHLSAAASEPALPVAVPARHRADAMRRLADRRRARAGENRG